ELRPGTAPTRRLSRRSGPGREGGPHFTMKTDFVDVNETRKNVRVEIPSSVVDAEIDRIAADYSRKVRVPGFRPGKAPARVIKQRYKDQILHDVAHDLIPRAVDDALRERGVEAVDTPDVRDVTIEQGQPLTFTASFDTVPTFDPGEFSTIAFRRASKTITDEAVHAAEREDRAELMKQLAARVPFEVPASMVDREVERRVEDFARRLIDQNMDPRQTGIDWNAFRESQRGVAREAVAAALVLDEVSRREQLEV